MLVSTNEVNSFQFFPSSSPFPIFYYNFPGKPDIFNVRDEKLHRLRWHRKVSNATAWWFQQTHARPFQEAQHLYCYTESRT